MSNDVLAYKILNYVVSDEPSLNMVDDDDWLQTDSRYLDSDGKGLLIIEKSKILKAMKKAKNEQNPDDKEMYLKVLNKLLLDCNNKEFCVYWCY